MFLRLHRARAGGERIEWPRGYLSSLVSRLALDHLRSTAVRRESYVGEWLPERDVVGRVERLRECRRRRHTMAGGSPVIRTRR
jgi:DNA-directed RNA polymerase specialized sigma24 family protein